MVTNRSMLTSRVTEERLNISAVLVLRTLGRREAERAAVERDTREWAASQTRLTFLQSSMGDGFQFSGVVSVAALVLFAADLARRGQMTSGHLSSSCSTCGLSSVRSPDSQDRRVSISREPSSRSTMYSR
jgi:ABC-type transport system involved in cytochrome bd biosynthesis fused ATPase/permease subunit